MTAKGKAYNYNLLEHSNSVQTTKLLKIAHIPLFLVDDGFEKDINAAEVL